MGASTLCVRRTEAWTYASYCQMLAFTSLQHVATLLHTSIEQGVADTPEEISVCHSIFAASSSLSTA